MYLIDLVTKTVFNRQAVVLSPAALDKSKRQIRRNQGLVSLGDVD